MTAWTALLSMHVSLLVLIDFADLSLGMVLLHLFTFDPAWLRQRGARRHERSIRDDCEPGAPSAGRAEWLGARVA